MELTSTLSYVATNSKVLVGGNGRRRRERMDDQAYSAWNRLVNSIDEKGEMGAKKANATTTANEPADRRNRKTHIHRRTDKHPIASFRYPRVYGFGSITWSCLTSLSLRLAEATCFLAFVGAPLARPDQALTRRSDMKWQPLAYIH